MKFARYLALIILASGMASNAEEVQRVHETEKQEPVLCLMTTPTILESVLSKLLDDEEPLVFTQEERDALLRLIESGLPDGAEKEALVAAIKKVPIKDKAQE